LVCQGVYKNFKVSYGKLCYNLCEMTNNDFSQWLLDEIREQGWSYSELARKGEISHARISQVISGDAPGADFCNALARALDLPPEFVFRKAGLLPPEPATEKPSLREALHLFDQLDPEERRLILNMMRGALRERRRMEATAHPV
jgi:transcriptional regulator with XRE-family HTH domain